MYGIGNDREFNSNIVRLIDMYLAGTLSGMNQGMLNACILGIEDILKGIGFDINKCVLLGVPICLKHQKCLTHYTIEDCYREDSNDVYSTIIRQHYGEIKYLRDNYMGRDITGKDKFSFLGALKITFMDMERFDSYTLVIDMYSGYALLFDRDIIKVYGINRHLLKSNIALKYRKMGIEAIPDVFLMGVYGINSWDNDLIDEEWIRYNLNFNTVFKKLSKSEFVRVFKKNVEGYKKN